jgi:ClpP class serine protease
MTNYRSERYARSNTVLAIHPKAFFELFLYGEAERENTVVGDACIVDVQGPLEQHAHPWFDSYAAITERVRAACATPCRAVVLRFDSPGGEAAGCFDCSRELRAICDAAGKQLHAYVEGDCCSAAYAMAASCQTITVGETSISGSIGVLLAREDYSAMNASNGIRVAFITSGERKADGHPDNPITDAELGSLKSLVDAMADVFFQHVAATRGLAAGAIEGLQAAMLHGAAAVSAGLADAVGTLTSVLALIAGDGTGGSMSTPYEKARAALEQAAQGDDANANAAKAALAAMDAASGGTGGDQADDPDKQQPTEPTEPKTAGDPPAPADDDKKNDPAAMAASAYREAIAARQEVAKYRAEIAKRDEAEERRTLIASRPNLDPSMAALLQKAPIALVRETIKAMPAEPINPALERAPLRGDGSGAPGGLPPEEKRRLDERMGVVARAPADQSNERRLVLGAGRRAAATAPADPGKQN